MLQRPNSDDVSEELLIRVDARNRRLGVGPKSDLHHNGVRHRAFSIFLVDNAARMLLQRRQLSKYHSGGLWANACCGHPRQNERTKAAAHRRLSEELGLQAPLSFGFRTAYREGVGSGLVEDEVVYLFFGPFVPPARPNAAEVMDLKLLSLSDLRAEITARPDEYAVWLRCYIKGHYSQIETLCTQHIWPTVETYYSR